MEDLLAVVVCPECQGKFKIDAENLWRCQGCGQVVQTIEGKPIFTPTPETAHIFKRIERGPDKGTPWRQANWRFLEAQIHNLGPQALILDVGAGHGDFADIFTSRNYLSMDIVPYEEVHLVCDLTERVPFRENTFDALVLMNVLEHVYRFHELMEALFRVLKPGGKLFIAVPFMIKIHQAPFDFHRYTHYSLREIAAQHGFEVELLEGYYDPIFFMGEGTRNFRFWVLPKLSRPARWLGRGLLVLVDGLMAALSPLAGKPFVKTPEDANNPAAIGYHLILRKPASQST
jgi:SAM-dependent methyltransferase